MPSVVFRTAFKRRRLHLMLRYIGSLIFRSEYYLAPYADDLGLRPTQQPLSSSIPARDGTVFIHSEHRIFGRALHKQTQEFLAGGLSSNRKLLSQAIAINSSTHALIKCSRRV